MPQPHAPAPVRRPAPPPPPAAGPRIQILLRVSDRPRHPRALGYAAYSEFQASRLQARYFSGVARDMKFVVEPGAEHLDPLSRRPALTTSAWATASCRRSSSACRPRATRSTSQARVTHQLGDLIEAGYAPPYAREDAGRPPGARLPQRAAFQLRLPGARLQGLRVDPDRRSSRALLFIENRELLDATYPDAQPGGRMDALRPRDRRRSS